MAYICVPYEFVIGPVVLKLLTKRFAVVAMVNKTVNPLSSLEIYSKKLDLLRKAF
jgi:hypothetical protein